MIFGVIITLQEVKVDSTQVIKLLTADGWVLDRIKGSHHQFKHPLKKGLVTVPHPRKDLGHLVKSIKKQAGL